MIAPGAQLYVAVDTADPVAARHLVAQLAGRVDGIKLGLEFFCANGPDGIRRVLGDSGLPLFLDLKLHDIPNTVAAAIRATAPLQPHFLTVHAAGGAAMLKAAADTATEAAGPAGRPPRLLAVTVLTSLDADDLTAVGMHADLRGQVFRLARLAIAAGANGVVCSPAEARELRSVLTQDAVLVTPGIRPAGGEKQDQKRAASPARAVADGADILVVGRPITRADDPAAAAAAIRAEMQG